MSSLKLGKLLKPYRIENGRKFRLKQVDPADTGGLSLDHDTAAELLKEGIERLAELQECLYAERRWAVLVIFQAMDAAGKDSAIKHVMSGINPQGCRVYSFRKPSEDELDHDYMCATSAAYRSAGISGSSTAPTTRKCSWCEWSASC
ncbi:MAG TPA: hypothetical protein VH184_22500 [Dongiaceae bacterium]|nr:hypothetical protein [Dongiaceae bacterium]